MTLLSYAVSRRLLIVFTLLIFSLFVFQPRPQTTAASEQSRRDAQGHPSEAAATHSGGEPRSSLIVSYPKHQKIPSIPRVRMKIEKKQTNVAKIISNLAKAGPLFPEAAFSMSDFKVQALVKGRWPIVVEYELEADSTAEVTISINNGEFKFPVRLRTTNGKTIQVTDHLPGTFGEKPQLGEVSFKAFRNGPEPRRPANFFLYGLGFGDKAVGSMVVDHLEFQPPSIHPKLNEKASCSFHSLSDFDSGSADFMRVTYPDNVYHFEPVARKKLNNGIAYDEWLAKDWDGKNDKGKISPGRHQFRVRVWRTLQSGGDWVSAFSKHVVKVE
jgi:hypothetical protein